MPVTVTPSLSRFSRVDKPQLRVAKVYKIFGEHEAFEPSEEAIEECLYTIDDLSSFKVKVVFVGQVRVFLINLLKIWSSNVVLNPEMENLANG